MTFRLRHCLWPLALLSLPAAVAFNGWLERSVRADAERLIASHAAEDAARARRLRFRQEALAFTRPGRSLLGGGLTLCVGGPA